jgi:O-antigen ligase
MAMEREQSLQQGPRDRERNERCRILVLLFMAALYPFVVVPGAVLGFTLPKYTALALAAGIALILLLTGRQPHLDRRLLIPLGLFLLFLLTATILAPDPYLAWFGLYRYTGFCTYLFCIILFLLAAGCRGPAQILRVLQWMSAAAALVSLIGILQHLGFNFIPHYFHGSGHPYATIGNRNFLGTYTVFILPAAAYFYLRSGKTAWLLCTALVYAGLFVSATRGAWLALPVPLLLLFIHLGKEPGGRRYILIVCLTLLLTTAMLAPTNDWQLLKRAASIPEQLGQAVELLDSAGSNRLYIWKETLRLIPANWAFGVGPDHLDIPLGPGYYADKAHNIYLEIAVTMGLFALGCYLWFLATFLRLRGWRRSSSVLLLIMILAYLCQGFFNIDVVGVMPLFWITLGFLAAPGQPAAGKAAASG